LITFILWNCLWYTKMESGNHGLIFFFTSTVATNTSNELMHFPWHLLHCTFPSD
jgi:hypothetical protein